jgi:alkyl sulfatase BDS1-like metallo-beta-lactamase superfamily hydrolase
MKLSSSHRVLVVLIIVLATSNVPVARGQQGVVANNPTDLVRVGDKVIKVNDAISFVYTLMQEIKLPPALDVGESYGNLVWSIRGIYEGYVGWFDLNPAAMYDRPAASVYPDVVKLAGGPDAVAALATHRVQSGDAVAALYLTDIALAADPRNRRSLEARLKALEILRLRCKNTNERGWLDYSTKVTAAMLDQKH